MSGGDPVEEGGAQLRQGFIQAFQTGAMVANFLERRGADARSASAHAQSMQNSAAREARDLQVHRLKVQGYVDRRHQGQRLFELDEKFKLDESARKQTLHERQVEGYDDRQRWGQAEHDTELQVKNEQIRRGNRDLARRDYETTVDQQRQNEVHDKRIQGYNDRAKYAETLHDLDVEYKKLLIEIRRRAAGFADDLSSSGRADAEAMKAAAGFASAHYTSNLSDAHAAHVDAYRERFDADTGPDAEDFLDDLKADFAVPRQPKAAGPEIIDAEIVGELPHRPEPAALLDVIDAEIVDDPSAARAVNTTAALAKELIMLGHAEHDAATLSDPAAAPDLGTEIGEAIQSAGLTGEVGIGLDPEPGLPEPGRAPDADIGVQR
ncbi:hypothetical protein [Nocardia sp. XZ_19_385]|uniref:hypothetical protein n=1 Tax=Nocardia sp. XZ_19_385 TaxID=2769488 RepID=UPI0018904228|nr:hypothetical protein [Nocardia sp. XZ_19_385]